MFTATTSATWFRVDRARSYESIAVSSDGMKVIAEPTGMINDYIYTSSDRGSSKARSTGTGSRTRKAVGK